MACSFLKVEREWKRLMVRPKMIIVYLVIFSSPHLNFQQSQYRTSFLCLSLLSLLLLWWLENHLNCRIKDSLHVLYYKGEHISQLIMKVMTNFWVTILSNMNKIYQPAVFLNYIQCKQELQSAFSVPLPSKKVGNQAHLIGQWLQYNPRDTSTRLMQ